MSKLDKAKDRICSIPTDYSFTEARGLLGKLGYAEHNKGKTSGSRVMFYRESDSRVIMLHKPHPGDIMDKGAVKSLVEFLKGNGDL